MNDHALSITSLVPAARCCLCGECLLVDVGDEAEIVLATAAATWRAEVVELIRAHEGIAEMALRSGTTAALHDVSRWNMTSAEAAASCMRCLNDFLTPSINIGRAH